MIRNMRKKGMSIRSIAKEMGISRNSVRKYLKNEPVKKNKKKRASKLDLYRDDIKALIEGHNLFTVWIIEEIKKKGYDGSYTILKEYCHDLRKDSAVKAVYRYETEPGKQSQVDFGEFTTDIGTENVVKMHLNAFWLDPLIGDSIVL